MPMPLIILTGLPCSGKSRRAEELSSFFSTSAFPTLKSVVVISDESLNIVKSIGYKNSFDEKKSRGAHIAAVERHLSKDTLVISDNLNYIKGFRYQLYCIARAIGTTQAVIHVATLPDTCNEFYNRMQQQSSTEEKSFDLYSRDVFEELLNRYEEPDGRNRWDSPLFTVLPSDECLPLEDIRAALFDKAPKPPNLSTVIKPASEAGYLSQLDSIARSVVDRIISEQIAGTENIFFPQSQQTYCVSSCGMLTIAKGRRLIKDFVHFNKMRPIKPESIEKLFLEFLKANACTSN